MDAKPGMQHTIPGQQLVATATSIPTSMDGNPTFPPSRSRPEPMLPVLPRTSLLAGMPGASSTCLNVVNSVDMERCDCGGGLIISNAMWVCTRCGLVHGRQAGQSMFIMREQIAKSKQSKQFTMPPTWMGCGTSIRVGPDTNHQALSSRWFHLAIVDKQTISNATQKEKMWRIRQIGDFAAQHGISQVVIEQALTRFKKRLESKEPVRNNVTLFAALIYVVAQQRRVPLTIHKIAYVLSQDGHRVSPHLIIQACLRENGKRKLPALQAVDFISQYVSALGASRAFNEKMANARQDPNDIMAKIERVARAIIFKCKGHSRRPSIMAASAIYGALLCIHKVLGTPKLSQHQVAEAIGIATYSLRDVFVYEIHPVLGGIVVE